MKKYLHVLLQEKGIDPEDTLNIDGHFNLQVGMLIEFICSLPADIQKRIKNTIVKIDFSNGDILHYFKFLGKGMVQSL